MSTGPGELIATGSRSAVFAWGKGAVAKVALPSTPEGWIRAEADFVRAVHQCGAPAPKVLGIEQLDGRDICIYERIDGPSLWDEAMSTGANLVRIGKQMGELHQQLLSIRAPLSVPSQKSRLSCKIRDAADRVDPIAARALPLLARTANAASLCHGDFHPKNIILSARGPIVVDWFDVSRGNPIGDIARSALLLGGGHSIHEGTEHLPGASANALCALHASYLDTVLPDGADIRIEFAAWMHISAAARLAEGVDSALLLAVLSGVSAA